MDKRSAALKKRLNTDRIITLVVAFLMIFVGAFQFITFAKSNDTLAVRRGIHSIFSAVALILLYLGLNRIAVTGKPFDIKIINILRAMAITIMVGGILPPFVEGFISVTQGNTFELRFGDIDIFVPLAGVIVGILSEIFVYGKDLQEDNDLIA